MTRSLHLKGTVKPDQRVALEDLGQVRWALSRLGLFDPSRGTGSGWETVMSNGLARALRVFQGGQGLHEDATLESGGPTEERLNRLLVKNRGLKVMVGPDEVLDEERQRSREGTAGALAGRVGLGLENHPADVATLDPVLRRLGHIKPGAPRPPMTGGVFGGLKSFQRATGLKHDGIIAPDGPTERLLARMVAESFEQARSHRAERETAQLLREAGF